MGNEEFRQNEYSNQQKQLESTGSESPSTTDNQSNKIQKLQDQVQQLQDQLAIYETEFQKREEELKKELKEKTEAFDRLNVEMNDKTQSMVALSNEIEGKNEKLINLEERLNQIKSESQKQINEKSEQLITMELELREIKNELSVTREKTQEYKAALQKTQTMIDGLQGEKEAYLSQIAKMQDVIQQTEEEIKEIEVSHLEVQDQLKLEISRMEERTGQMREDLVRESTGTLARDRHIRVVLQQSELGRILLFLVDYFENTKKKSLALDTLSTEVGIPPIICRTHLRHLHELAVCDFNEVTREIRLIKRAK
ncbi:MAG: hypothetical protein JSW11_08790 [Candidatus Heimdallarchaeota archaeon]|nr:MAG: hypothetical protein JSW11_08790 [Candidatus Heimdallarchaeota archaeon]